jgi:hypothetical protein
MFAAEELPTQALNILTKNCFACHGGGLRMSGLDLRTRDAAMAGGDRRAAIVPHYPDKSLAYLFATGEQKPSMPPGQTLSPANLDVLKRWILAGAEWPSQQVSQKDADAKAAMLAMEERPIKAEERDFWSFRAVVRPAIPVSAQEKPIDAFLAARWREKKLMPQTQADKRTLVRRAFLDLTGLPPSPDEVREFADDKSPGAWSRLVDRLLDSPHYGERWARYWLDLVRYADSGGFEYDVDRDAAWRYRDYVVQAFNNDKPYDEFIREQIAGDEYRGTAEARIATGFLRLGPENNVKNEMTRLDELDDIIQTTSLAFLGMTVGCARCHNHKFDPIPQKDYYRIQAVFFNTKTGTHPLVDAGEVTRYDMEVKRIDALQTPHKRRKSEIEKPYRARIFEERLAKLAPYMQEAWRTAAEKRTEGQKLNAKQIERIDIKEEEIRERMSAADRALADAEESALKSLTAQRPRMYDAAMVAAEEGPVPLPSYFLHRGSPASKGSQVDAGVLTIASLQPITPIPQPPGAQTTWRRRNFAEWVASAGNPLTARVMVNRIWQRHFGEGIVATPNNFGKTGALPTHPELLDFLASEFVRSGWSVKKMHRMLMNSEAYRMRSDDVEANRKVDPANRFLWRMPRQRLDAETIRDNMLSVAGTLDRKMGGPGVLPYIDPALFQSSSKRTWNGKQDTDASTWRRSLYVFNKRTIRYPMFEAFDQPDMITSCARRNSSVTAPQALLLMNNGMVRMHARHFADRLKMETGDDAARLVERAFELALIRKPTQAELERSVTFIRNSPEGLLDFCQAIFNLNEFVYTP